MSIQTLAASIASLIPEMAKDSPVNNAIVIQMLIERELTRREGKRHWYLTEFPDTYRNHTYWDAAKKERAESFVADILRSYQVQGKLTLVEECL